MVLLSGSAQSIENDAGLNARDLAHWIDFENCRHVFRKVEDDGGVAALSGKRRASATGEQRSAMVAAKRNGGEDIFFVARNYDADRDLAIVGAVGCVESATTLIEANFSTKMAAEGGFKRGSIELRGTGWGWSDVLWHRTQNIFEDAGA
jgi:hypothetical protein